MVSIKNTQSNNIFSDYGKYYDLLYADKNYEAEIDYILTLLSEHKIKGGVLLELGSGTGRHANLLAKNGYDVVGVEKSEEMIEQAQKNEKCTFLLGDILDIKLETRFDAALSLFHVVSYLTSNEQISQLFQNTSLHLRAGGLFIFDVWFTPSVAFHRPEVRVKRMADNEVEITRIAAPNILENENIVEVNYTIFSRNKHTGSITSFEELHPMRHFSTPEILLLARAHGFELLRSEEFLTGKAPSKDTWGVCYVLQKVA